MPVMYHDTTGKTPDCPRPLSRKKLKQLMPMNKGLTARALFHQYKRMSPQMQRDLLAAQRETEANKKKEEALKLAGVPPEERGPEEEIAKPSIFRRLSGMFAGLKKAADRKKAMGK